MILFLQLLTIQNEFELAIVLILIRNVWMAKNTIQFIFFISFFNFQLIIIHHQRMDRSFGYHP